MLIANQHLLWGYDIQLGSSYPDEPEKTAAIEVRTTALTLNAKLCSTTNVRDFFYASSHY